MDINEIFNQFSEIKYTDYKNFIEQIDTVRNNFEQNDKTLLDDTGVTINIDDINELPNGRFSTTYKGVEFECMLAGEKKTKLYVVLSGSRTMRESLPMFRRWSYYKYFDGIMLNIADPMLRKYENLHLGWYYGTENECYLDYIVHIVKMTAKALGMGNENIIFFASSDGGYAALYCASKIDNCTVLAINPQIRLSFYAYSKAFKEITGLDLEIKDKFGRNNLPNLIKNATKTNFIILCNCRCENDIDMLEDLCNTVGNNMFSYGLTKINQHIWTWVYDALAIDPHNAQDYWPMIVSILQLADMEKFPENKDLYLLLNEFWHDRTTILYKEYKKNNYNEYNPTEIFSSVGNQISQMIPENVFFSKQIIIDSRNNEYNCFDFNVRLKPNTVYHLEMDGSKVLQGETSFLIFAFGNQKYSMRNYSKTIDIGKKASISFKTAKTDCIVLKMYPSNPGSCANISVEISNLSLSCYEDKAQYLMIKNENYNIYKKIIRGEELVRKHKLTDSSATFMIFNRHLGDAARTIKFVAPYKDYYSNDEKYHSIDMEKTGINPLAFPKNRKINRVVAVTTSLLSGVVRLCPDVDDILILPKEDIDCIEQFARSGILTNNNIIPDEQSRIDWTKDILTGGNSQAERLMLPSDILRSKQGKATVPEKTIDETKKIIDEYSIDTKKTIIVLPYARSSSELDMEKWEKITHTFSLWGYKVFTNIGKNESAVEGTIPLCVPVDVFCALAEAGCLIVGVQSGLVDVLIRLDIKYKMYVISVIRNNDDLQYALNRGITNDIVAKSNNLTYFRNTAENNDTFCDKFLAELSNELNNK